MRLQQMEAELELGILKLQHIITLVVLVVHTKNVGHLIAGERRDPVEVVWVAAARNIITAKRKARDLSADPVEVVWVAAAKNIVTAKRKARDLSADQKMEVALIY